MRIYWIEAPDNRNNLISSVCLKFSLNWGWKFVVNTLEINSLQCLLKYLRDYFRAYLWPYGPGGSGELRELSGKMKLSRDEHRILWFNVQVLLTSTWAILLSKHVTFPIKKSRSSITCTGKEGEGYVLTYTGLLSTLHLKGFTLRSSFDWTSYYATTWLICIKISRSMSKLTLNCFRLLGLCPEDTFHSF